MSKPISKYLSRKIKFISVFAMFAIVFVHSYNYGNGTLTSDTFISHYEAAEMFEYFFSNGLFAFAIPTFFIISGFLLFIKYENTVQGYFDKMKHRIFPLLVPYVLWAILSGLTVTILNNFEPVNQVDFIIRSDALFFFGIGAAFAILGKWRNFTKPDNKVSTVIFALLWIGLSFLQMYLAVFTRNPIILNIVHKLTVLTGIAGMWLVFDFIVRFLVTKKGLLLASAHLFFVFALHEPLLKISYQMAIIPDSTDGSHFILYICLPISVIAVCMILSMVMRKVLRPVHNLLTGGRNS